VRVFLDANVLFSASQPGSAFFRLVLLAKARASVLASDLAIEEARRNIRLKRTAWQPTFETVLEGIEVVASTLFPLPVDLDEKDRPLLCAAIKARAELFVTGDRRDFGQLFGMSVLGVEVIPPKRLAEILTAGK
jgi:predicted nucleic acid-binding protein